MSSRTPSHEALTQTGAPSAQPPAFQISDAEALLQSLAALSARRACDQVRSPENGSGPEPPAAEPGVPILEARYQALLEQMSAIVFMAHLDRGTGEAYVSPQIEAALGFSQQEWLEDPVRWYAQIHPDDKQRWSLEAAQMLLTGQPLRSVYRVLARDGHVVWFHCEAKMVRRPDGAPWFIQGVGFDISDVKRAEQALHDERNLLSAILDTVGALVMVLDPNGRIVRFNRACELTTGYSLEEARGRVVWELLMIPEEVDDFKVRLAIPGNGRTRDYYETIWLTRNRERRRMLWSSTALLRPDGSVDQIVATGMDITERRHLQKTIVEAGDQEARRIGRDLHDGLGQHLTGIAFRSKVLEAKLDEQTRPEVADARAILRLVNEAINKARELARGSLSVVSSERGLTSALEQIAADAEDLFKVACHVEDEDGFEVGDVNVATHLCHIAREAVHNAVKHGGAKTITIALSNGGDSGALIVEDDGAGISEMTGAEDGMGLRIMRYRAGLIGGRLQINRNARGGTVVRCVFPGRR